MELAQIFALSVDLLIDDTEEELWQVGLFVFTIASSTRCLPAQLPVGMFGLDPFNCFSRASVQSRFD